MSTQMLRVNSFFTQCFAVGKDQRLCVLGLGSSAKELAGRSHLSRYIEMSTPKPRCLKISWLPGGFALRRPWDREIMRLRGSIMEEQAGLGCLQA